MKILFVGVLDVNSSANLPMKDVLESYGHEVVAFNYRTVANKFDSVRNRPGKFIDRWLDRAASFLRSDRVPIQSEWYFNRKGRKEMNAQLIGIVKSGQFDLVLFCKADSVNYRNIPEISLCSPTWYYFMDWKHTASGINAKEYAKNSTWCSATYSDITELFREYNSKSLFLTQAFDKRIFFPDGNEKKEDVVFVGSANKKRVKIINFLKRNGINVTCFGARWANGPVYGEQLAETYRRAKIVLNLQHGSPQKQGQGFSMRVYQVMAAGSFLLSEYCEDLDKIFKREKHLDWFESPHECLTRIKHYLARQDSREYIATEGCNYVQENYSWENIINEICKIVKADSKKSYNQNS